MSNEEEPVVSAPVAATPDTTAPQTEPEVKTETRDPAEIEREFREKAKQYLVEQTSHVIIPSFAQWFDMNKVHLIEEKLFPDFDRRDLWAACVEYASRDRRFGGVDLSRPAT